MKRFICLLLVLTQLAACTALSTVPYGEGAAAKGQAGYIAPGDNLRITFREGGEKRIKVTSTTAGEICAADGCIRVAEIATVERADGTMAAVAGVALALLVVLAVGAILSGMHPLGGGLGSAGLH